jgi:hypothetical protein
MKIVPNNHSKLILKNIFILLLDLRITILLHYFVSKFKKFILMMIRI